MTNLSPYPDVNEALLQMLAGIRTVLGDRLVGYYVFGSLALGGFDLEKSDLDTLAVVDTPLTPDDIAALGKMHTELFAVAPYWVKEMEVFYCARSVMDKYDAKRADCHRLYEGRFTPFWQGDDWVLHRHVLREMGVVVFGPHPNTMIDPVPPQDIQAAVKIGIIRNWWAGKVLQNPVRLERDLYRVHSVLAMCRALYTLETGKLGTKQEAAEWAASAVDARYQPLVRRANAWKPGMVFEYDLTAACDFIKYVAEKTA